jgi:hypothetical protein
MNGTHDTSSLDYMSAEKVRRPAESFMRPEEVVSDLRLTNAEKREILASWASDVRAVSDAPALRQLDNGAVVHIDDVLQALNSLNEGETSEQTSFNPLQAYKDMRIRLSRRLRSSLRKDWPDDDDPPPCPVIAARPPRGPLSGEGAADLSSALAA